MNPIARQVAKALAEKLAAEMPPGPGFNRAIAAGVAAFMRELPAADLARLIAHNRGG